MNYWKEVFVISPITKMGRLSISEVQMAIRHWTDNKARNWRINLLSRFPSKKNIKIQGNLSFDYVDYDISPLRTTGNPGFESGESSRSSGTGGIDLLLSNAEDQFPIVGEIKAEKDATPLLALIQALTYAIELATPSQRERLQSIYPGRFKFAENGPSIDIYLLLVSPPGDDGAKDFLKAVGSLCKNLLQLKFTPTVIRKIVCLQTELRKPGSDFVFETNFCWMK